MLEQPCQAPKDPSCVTAQDGTIEEEEEFEFEQSQSQPQHQPQFPKTLPDSENSSIVVD
ncbi:MAG: hypothetical protein WBF33_36115 [Candidatus Nitrosopolaris sp.]|jgi:hypothetical protein